MGQFKQKKIYCTFILAFLFLGCSSHDPHIMAFHKDRSFVRAQLVEDMLGICGIISIDPQFDEVKCKNFANLLHEVLREKRGDLVIAPVRQIVGLIGKTTHNEIMSEYKEYPTPLLKSLKKIAFVENDFRYLLLGSIDLNKTREDQFKEVRLKDVSDTTLNADLKIDEQETLEEEILSVFKTTRTIRVSFLIYDLRTACLVWSCTLEDNGSNRRSIVLNKKDGVVKEFAQSLTLGVIQGFYGPLIQPTAPKFETLLKRVFRAFADRLP